MNPDGNIAGKNAHGKRMQTAGKQLLAVAFAIFLLWLAFKDIDAQEFWRYVKEIRPVWLLWLFVAAILSHIFRAKRWIIMLEPLVARRLGLWNAFCALLLGYAVNLVIPRGGEVARLVSISRTERLPWMGALSTVFIDRLMDIAVVVLLLGLTLVIFPIALERDFSWLVPGGILLTVVTIASLICLPFMSRITAWLTRRGKIATSLPANVLTSINNLASQFDTGTRCLTNPRTYPAIVLLTAGMWFCYWLNFYFMILAFNLERQVSPSDCLIAFTVGSIGVIVPTPGAVGSFHFLVSQTLVIVSGLNKELALAYATVLHIFAFIITTCLPAAICLAIQSGQTRTAPQAGSKPDTS